MVTFNERLSDNLKKTFWEIEKVPSLTSTISTAVADSFAYYLRYELYHNKTMVEEIVIGAKDSPIFNITLTISKKGDVVAFLPEFNLLDGGERFVNGDDFNVNTSKCTDLGYQLTKNSKFVDILAHCLRGDCLSKENEWTNGDESEGVKFVDETDLGVACAYYIYTIFEILCERKDPTADVEYEVPSFGKFKISPIKSGYTVSCLFDKRFKANCKSDTYGDKLVTTDAN